MAYRIVAKHKNETTYRWMVGSNGLVNRLIHACIYRDSVQALDIRNHLQHYNKDYHFKLKRFR